MIIIKIIIPYFIQIRHTDDSPQRLQASIYNYLVTRLRSGLFLSPPPSHFFTPFYSPPSDYPGYFGIVTPNPHVGWVGGGGELTKISIFSTVHEMSQTFEFCTRKTHNPRWGGVLIVVLLFSTVHFISRTFDFLTH